MTYLFNDDDAPHRIAASLRELAIKCTRLGGSCTDKNLANEIEGLGTELAQEALKIDNLFSAIEKAS